MTRPSSAFLLRRAYEQLLASAGAVALTLLLVLSVDARAAARAVSQRTVTPSVTIQIPTVEIEVIGNDTTSHVASAAAEADRVNG
jgi:hypothetical protein